jgi:hypothetical protein
MRALAKEETTYHTMTCKDGLFDSLPNQIACTIASASFRCDFSVVTVLLSAVLVLQQARILRL